MSTRPLWEQGDEGNDERGKDDGCRVSAQREADVCQRPIEKIADGGCEWPGQDEGRPEQKDV